MAEQLGSDHVLLAAIRGVYDELDPVPPEVTAAARASLTWLTVDAELAEISLDSLLEAGSGIRSTVAPRLVSFEAPTLTVEVEICETGDTRRLVGQLVPPSEAEIVVRHQDGHLSVSADQLGRFTAEGVPGGPVSLLVHFPAAPMQSVVTSWVIV